MLKVVYNFNPYKNMLYFTKMYIYFMNILFEPKICAIIVYGNFIGKNKNQWRILKNEKMDEQIINTNKYNTIQ